jgi:hypothetical protein
MPWPIIGNTYQLPDNKPWIYFEELSKKYNTPIITYWIGRLVMPSFATHLSDWPQETPQYGSMMRGPPTNS